MSMSEPDARGPEEHDALRNQPDLLGHEPWKYIGDRVRRLERTRHQFGQDAANIRRHREIDGVVQAVGGQAGPSPMDPAAREARRGDDREAGMAMLVAVALVASQA